MADTTHSLSDSGLGQAVRALTRKGDRLASRQKTWARYMKKLGGDVSRIERNTAVKDMIRREGIPPEHRGKVWIALTGVREQCSSDVLTYRDLVKTFDGLESVHTKQVDKDLRRTFPDGDEDQDTIDALRRILVAYSWLNPEIGYCQSMNFITALFLLFMDEEEAFWMLKITVEEILPQDYYSHSMLGVRVDEYVLMDLLQQKLPKVHAHIEEVGMPLSSVVTPWFMCLFINILPLECTLRFFDSLFVEGSKMLFRLALALFKVHSKAILASNDFDEVFMVLKSVGDNTDAGVLLEAAFNKDWMGSMPGGKISSLRQQYHAEFMRTALEEKKRWEQLQEESKTTESDVKTAVMTTAVRKPSVSDDLDLPRRTCEESPARRRAATATPVSSGGNLARLSPTNKRRPPPGRRPNAQTPPGTPPGGAQRGASRSPMVQARPPPVPIVAGPPSASSAAAGLRGRGRGRPNRARARGRARGALQASHSGGSAATLSASGPAAPQRPSRPARGRGMPKAISSTDLHRDARSPAREPAPARSPAHSPREPPARSPRSKPPPRAPTTGGASATSGGDGAALSSRGGGSPSWASAGSSHVLGNEQDSLSELDTKYKARFRPLSMLVANRRKTNELFESSGKKRRPQRGAEG